MSEQVFASSDFYVPHYVRVPDHFFDVLLTKLTNNELRVLLYLMRRTFGFNKYADNVSLSQLCKGITKRDGTVLDSGTGLCRDSVISGLRALTTRGIIQTQRHQTEQGNYEVTTYSLRQWALQPSPSPQVTAPLTPSRRERPPLVETVDYPQSLAATTPGRLDRPPLVDAIDLQDTVQNPVQETGRQDPQPLAPPQLQLVANEVKPEEPTVAAEAKALIGSYVTDYALLFNAQEPLRASIARAIHRWEDSHLGVRQFIARMQTARELVQRRAVKSLGMNGRITRMASWFSILEDITTRSEQYAHAGARHEPEAVPTQECPASDAPSHSWEPRPRLRSGAMSA